MQIERLPMYERLQEAYQILQKDPSADFFYRINWSEHPHLLSLSPKKEQMDEDIVLHITLNSEHPGKFNYEVLSNKGFRNPEKYRSLEKNVNLDLEEIIPVIRRIFMPAEDNQKAQT